MCMSEINIIVQTQAGSQAATVYGQLRPADAKVGPAAMRWLPKPEYIFMSRRRPCGDEISAGCIKNCGIVKVGFVWCMLAAETPV